MPDWLASGLARFENSYRFDMCSYGTAWRKRTRICTNTELAGVPRLCSGGHCHQQLRGRSRLHQSSWTRLAQVYPRKLCLEVAKALGRAAGLKPSKIENQWHRAKCARCSHLRIGEAKKPGPPKHRPPAPRDIDELFEAQLHEPTTLIIPDRVLRKFDRWLRLQFSHDTCTQVFLCPLLASQVLRQYGIHCFSTGEPMYELRHLLVVVQKDHPLLKPVLSPAWNVLVRWEEVRPLKHRIPLPETLFKAMFTAAVFKGWHRWAATFLLGYEGIARIGEVLNARRKDLVLPEDLFDSSHPAIFLKIRKPKSRRRGKGRIQQLKVERPETVQYIASVFGELDGSLPLFPLSASAFQTRWGRLLILFGVPRFLRPTPASIRGGGAISAYRRGESTQSILWRMRLVSQVTLESYLQELAAESYLADLPVPAKERIRFVASFFSSALESSG